MSTIDRIIAFRDSVDAYVLARHHWTTATGMLDEHLTATAERKRFVVFDFDQADESHYRREVCKAEVALYQAHGVIKNDGEDLHRDLPPGDARRLVRETLARLVPLIGSGRGVDFMWLQNAWPSTRLEIEETAHDGHVAADNPPLQGNHPARQLLNAAADLVTAESARPEPPTPATHLVVDGGDGRRPDPDPAAATQTGGSSRPDGPFEPRGFSFKGRIVDTKHAVPWLLTAAMWGRDFLDRKDAMERVWKDRNADRDDSTLYATASRANRELLGSVNYPRRISYRTNPTPGFEWKEIDGQSTS